MEIEERVEEILVKIREFATYLEDREAEELWDLIEGGLERAQEEDREEEPYKLEWIPSEFDECKPTPIHRWVARMDPGGPYRATINRQLLELAALKAELAGSKAA